MRDSLFNVMNDEVIAAAVGSEIANASSSDLLIPMICKGLSSGYSAEDFPEIKSMTFVNAYQQEMLGSPFTLSLSNLSIEELRVQQLSHMLDSLEYKDSKYMNLSANELNFYDGMLDIVTGLPAASLEADSAFGQGTVVKRAGGYLEKGAIKRLATTIKKLITGLLKLFIGLISNFLGFLGKAIGLLSKFFLWVKSIVDGGAERVGFKQAYIPKALEKRIKNNTKSKVKDASKNIESVLRAANSVDVTDEAAFNKFKELAMKVFPGDLEKQSPAEYVKTLVDPTEESGSDENTVVTADEFVNLVKKIDSAHAGSMRKVEKEAKRLNKTLGTFERDNKKLYQDVMSANGSDAASAKDAYKAYNTRIKFMRNIVQICTMVEDTVVKEELAVMKLLQSAKPKSD